MSRGGQGHGNGLTLTKHEASNVNIGTTIRFAAVVWSFSTPEIFRCYAASRPVVALLNACERAACGPCVAVGMRGVVVVAPRATACDSRLRTIGLAWATVARCLGEAAAALPSNFTGGIEAAFTEPDGGIGLRYDRSACPGCSRLLGVTLEPGNRTPNIV